MTDSDSYTIYRFAEKNPRNGLTYPDAMWEVWQPFMKEDEYANQYWDDLHDLFPDTLFYICDENDVVVAQGKSIPVWWDEDLSLLPDVGWDWAVESGIQNKQHDIEPNMLCALEMAVSTEHRGKGLSKLGLRTMRDIARERGFDTMIAPVRPVQKSEYPTVAMNDYMQWRREDGTPFDRWLRVHESIGGELLHVADKSMRVVGSIADWEAWTGMSFPGSGWHIVPGALNPVHIDLDADKGVYVEANVWVVHRL